MDKFPEAFNRFEKKVNVDDIASFRELMYAFASWAGQKWYGTRSQIEALAVEAQRIGIPVYDEKREERIRHFASVPKMAWRHELVIVMGKSQSRYRDLKTGRFIKKP